MDYRFLAEYSSDITLAIADGVIVYASRATRRMLGWQVDEVIGKPATSFVHPDDVPGVATALSLKGMADRDHRARARRRDGSYLWVEARSTLTSQTSPSGLPLLVVNVRDIQARKQLEDELAAAHRRLEAMAVTDAQTGLANRRRFDEALDIEFRRARRDGTSLSLVLVDADRFKSVNDTQGHQAGDALLRHVARQLADAAHRAGDLAARIGGDEFALLLPNTSLAGAERLAQHVRLAVAAADGTGFAPVPVSLSAGVASTRLLAPNEGRESLFRRADEALYEAKRRGRDGVVVASAGSA